MDSDQIKDRLNKILKEKEKNRRDKITDDKTNPSGPARSWKTGFKPPELRPSPYSANTRHTP